MSETNEKMDAFNTKAQRRQEQELKAKRERKKTRTIIILVVLVLALLFAGAMFLNSDYIRQNVTAITVGGVDFSAVEYDFFFNNTFNEYQEMVWQAVGDFAPQLLPVAHIPLRNQIQNHETGLTWDEFFHYQTVDQLSRLVLLYNAAAEYGYVMREEAREAMEEEIETLRTLTEAQLGLSLNNALPRLYGRGMNERIFRRLLTITFTANSFSDYMFEAFTYTEQELEEFYEENRDLFDNFYYRHILIRADLPDEVDFDSWDEYEASREEALEVARREAERIASELESEDDFIAMALEQDPEQFAEPESTLRINPGEWLGGLYGPWMREAGRAYGDTTTGETPLGAFVVFFVNRDPNEYRMTNMRQILIQQEEVWAMMFEEGEDDPAYQLAVEEAEREATQRAQNVYDMFIAGGATEELLIEMMQAYSDDWVEGGLYEDISRVAGQNKMVEPVEDWLFAPNRRVGDHGLVHTVFGYHILFLTEFGPTYREFIATERMRARDHEAWLESIGIFPFTAEEEERPIPIEVIWRRGFRFTQH